MSGYERDQRFALNRAQLLRRGALGAMGLGALSIVGCGDDDSGGSSPGASEKPSKPTGTLRVGFLAGTGGAVADPNKSPAGPVDIARTVSLYDELWDDFNGEIRFRLAEAVEPNEDATVWTVTLREGVKFHDGSPVRPEDVIASMKARQDPAVQSSVQWTRVKKMEKVDARTVAFTLDEPFGPFLQMFANSTAVVPENIDFDNPIGSGPFKFESYEPGRSMKFTANTEWWDDGPYVERLETYEFKDENARLNALLAGQIDALEGLSAAQYATLKTNESFGTVVSSSSASTCFAMLTTKPPFDDNRVRQAFTLIVNRAQMNQQVHGGLAKVANDVSGQFDPSYIGGDLPQREQDIERAKALLKEAGHENLTLDLHTTAFGNGSGEMSQVLVEQAKEAGVTLTLKQRDPSVFFTPEAGYSNGTRELTIDLAGGFMSYLAYASWYLVAGAPYGGVTQYSNKEVDDLYAQAMRISDDAERGKIVEKMMQIEYETTANVLWCFDPIISGFSSKVQGVKELKTITGLNGYQFATLWLS